MAELPLLETDFYSQYKSKGLEILAVCLDDGMEAIISTIAPMSLTYPILVDKNQSAIRTYKVRGIPLTLIIDKQGIIKYRETGFNPDSMRKVIEELLG